MVKVLKEYKKFSPYMRNYGPDIYYLPGTQYLIEALIEHYDANDNPRNKQERYNMIISALMGKQADLYKIDSKNINKRIKRLKLTKALLAMHDEKRENPQYSNKALAEKFIDQTIFYGDPKNAIKTLAADYSEACKYYRTEEDWMRYRDEVYSQELDFRKEDNQFIREEIRDRFDHFDRWGEAFSAIDDA